MDAFVREAYLKPEFADQYPPLQPGVWEPAAEVGAKVLMWRVQVHGTLAVTTRLLDPEHFEFRGGWRRGLEIELRTRADDTDPVEPGAPLMRRSINGAPPAPHTGE